MKWYCSSASAMGLKTIYLALFIYTMEWPLYKINALANSFLAPTEIKHFEW